MRNRGVPPGFRSRRQAAALQRGNRGVRLRGEEPGRIAAATQSRGRTCWSLRQCCPGPELGCSPPMAKLFAYALVLSLYFREARSSLLDEICERF